MALRVLWFTNVPPDGMSRALGRPPEVVGGWMSALLEALRRRGDLALAVASSVRGQRAAATHELEGVTYYAMPDTSQEGLRPTRAFLAACEAAERDFEPDIVHVHGTERLYGLYTAMRGRAPVVISVQGLIHECSRHVGGGLRLPDAAEAGLPGVLSWLRYEIQRWSWRRRGEVEKRILATNGQFIGRTSWDEAHVLANNSEATYFHCDEALRPAFYRSTWEPGRATPHSIFCTAAHSPLKGFHFVLDAVSLLRNEFPWIRVRVAGAPWDSSRGHGYYGRFLKRLIDLRGLSEHVVALPELKDDQVAMELASAAAFVIPSLVENSPNSLAEAMRVGTPCVASLVGGIPSMVEDGRTALGFPAGDAACLAHCLRRLFREAGLSARLSSAAREQAAMRHDVDRIVSSQVDIYRRIVSGSTKRRDDPIRANP